ncbi:MAG: hypothetical protein HN494_02765 [Opitutae bacterium]|jgi:hypothetical protein|nr:hypothetical protein [Opitutae bacterium]
MVAIKTGALSVSIFPHSGYLVNPPQAAKSLIPSYQDPWCWKCREHGDYIKKTEVVQHADSSSPNYTTTTFTCRICKKKMHAPQVWDPVTLKRPAARGCLLIYWILVVIGLAVFCLLEAPWNWNLGLLLAVFAPTITIFVLGPILVLRLSARKYAVWKHWAIQRGWQEPSLEKRAKMEVKHGQNRPYQGTSHTMADSDSDSVLDDEKH